MLDISSLPPSGDRPCLAPHRLRAARCRLPPCSHRPNGSASTPPARARTTRSIAIPSPSLFKISNQIAPARSSCRSRGATSARGPESPRWSASFHACPPSRCSRDLDRSAPQAVLSLGSTGVRQLVDVREADGLARASQLSARGARRRHATRGAQPTRLGFVRMSARLLAILRGALSRAAEREHRAAAGSPARRASQHPHESVLSRQTSRAKTISRHARGWCALRVCSRIPASPSPTWPTTSTTRRRRALAATSARS